MIPRSMIHTLPAQSSIVVTYQICIWIFVIYISSQCCTKTIICWFCYNATVIYRRRGNEIRKVVFSPNWSSRRRNISNLNTHKCYFASYFTIRISLMEKIFSCISKIWPSPGLVHVMLLYYHIIITSASRLSYRKPHKIDIWHWGKRSLNIQMSYQYRHSNDKMIWNSPYP